MKSILLTITFTILLTQSNCQSVRETKDFINDAIVQSSRTVYKLFYYEQLSVTEKGKLTVDTYMGLPAPHFEIFESRSAYLKNIKYVETKSIIDNSGNINYIISIKCNYGFCISRQIKTQNDVSNIDEISITVYNIELCEKVQNALKHLISFAKNNPNFLTKDIF